LMILMHEVIVMVKMRIVESFMYYFVVMVLMIWQH